MSLLLTEVRFREKVSPEPNSGCWLWTGAGDRDGYGVFTQRNKNVMAHRYSYELHKGSIPKGMLVCHTCDVPGCVNPDHLFLGTSKDNSDDRDRKGRNIIHIGENHPEAKLTDAAVRDIKTGRLSQSEFATLYGVKIGTIWKVLNGYSWTHVR